jgi:alpha-glucosidase
MVYLPEGNWYDFETKTCYEGKQYYLVDAPLDTCPMFVKEGSVIPTYELMQYTGEKPYDTLKLLVFPGKGTYEHYQDNGTDFAYKEGACNCYRFVNQGDGIVEKEMLHEGYPVYDTIEYIYEPRRF